MAMSHISPSFPRQSFYTEIWRGDDAGTDSIGQIRGGQHRRLDLSRQSCRELLRGQTAQAKLGLDSIEEWTEVDTCPSIYVKGGGQAQLRIADFPEIDHISSKAMPVRRLW